MGIPKSSGESSSIPLTQDNTMKEIPVHSNESASAFLQTNRKDHYVAVSSKKRASRPELVRKPSVQTRYMDMLLHLDTIPRLDNILASFFTWLLLAGYLVFPATFVSLSDSKALAQVGQNGGQLGAAVVNSVKNAPLLYIAAACCIVGGAGMLWLWWKWSSNYVWMINRIFMPCFLNSIAGLISTLVNVYSAQKGTFSVTARVTMIVTAACSAVGALLFIIYNFWALARVKGRHQREIEREEHEQQHEGLMEKVHRKIKEPALEPGSVV